MPFPDSQRVIYDSNPLQQVICQLRFPGLLRIESEPPAAFQEAIRNDYPELREKRQQAIPLRVENAEVLAQVAFPASSPSYDFVSEDGQWTAGLTSTFLALTCGQYSTWQGFEAHLEVPLHALLDIYQPSYFNRIGLRYTNVITRSAVGLSDVPWSSLLAVPFAGELMDPTVEASVEQATRELVVHQRDNAGLVRIKHGLAKKSESDEVCYLIDADLFLEGKLDARDIAVQLSAFNRKAGNLFRWAIAPRLHEALGPRPL